MKIVSTRTIDSVVFGCVCVVIVSIALGFILKQTSTPSVTGIRP